MEKQAENSDSRVKLESFLAGLPEEDASGLRAIASRMDEFERHALPVRGIERELRIPFLIAVVLFAIGLFLIFSGGWILVQARRTIGEPGLAALLGALPGLAAYYAYRVRWRTRADTQNFDLNREHFLPRGAIYFPATDAQGEAWIVRVAPDSGYKPKPSKNDKLKPGWIW
ncbi:MAG TPA: hypothetical protein VMX97_01685 [Hyphomicrobiaceae bacterium]|nr:hypothetical protein [Hyphomicrobiaceae bacterium]